MRNYIFITTIAIILTTSLVPKTVKNYLNFSEWISEFTYRAEKDGEDYWKTPEETIKDRGGDCEDFAILAVDTLRGLGYKMYLIVITHRSGGKQYGHAIALLKHDAGFSYFSNNKYFSTRHNNLRALLNNNYPKWIDARICNIDKQCFFKIKSKKEN